MPTKTYLDFESKLSASERSMLRELRSLDTNSIVRLRAALNWDLSRFATTLLALQGRGLLLREETRLKLTPRGLECLIANARPNIAERAVPHKQEVTAPKLPVDSLYLPDQHRFLRAQRRGLYTTEVSLASPE